ncbi:MAG: ABC transporter substrate-binding protein [Balneolales bacterium]
MKHQYIIIWISCILLLQACSSSNIETIVVDRTPSTPPAPEELEEEAPEIQGNILRIGEVNKITSLDPLFALNPASQRMIQLVYEGLVSLDEHDDILPAIANSWEISSDSLEYTFHLDRNISYHDDESFASGIGRQIRASDFKRAFERMASRDVPPNAAELFVDQIIGFEAYNNEQREVYLTEERTLDQIPGINAVNDSTLTFTLNEQDPYFLHKLATPFAVVYPEESLDNRTNGLKNHPVGTGSFTYNTSLGDTLHILNRNKNYHGTDENGAALPKLSRIEVLNTSNETNLFSKLALGQLNIIMELGPQMVRSLVNANNELNSSYRNQYELGVVDHDEPYIIQYNPNNIYNLDSGHASALAHSLAFDSLKAAYGNPSLQMAYRDNLVNDLSHLDDLHELFSLNQDSRRLIMGFGTDISSQILSAQIISAFRDKFNSALMNQRVLNRDIFLYLDQNIRYTPQDRAEHYPQEIMRFYNDRYILFNNELEGIKFNSYSWWVKLDHVTISELPS